MDQAEYLRLLSGASINNTSKFQAIPLERPKTRGRPPIFYHPLLWKEKALDSIVRRILPKIIAGAVRPTGSRVAHLYALPKTHKERLANVFYYQQRKHTIAPCLNGSTRN